MHVVLRVGTAAKRGRHKHANITLGELLFRPARLLRLLTGALVGSSPATWLDSMQKTILQTKPAVASAMTLAHLVAGTHR